MSFEKWTAVGNAKYIGVYLYAMEGKGTFCLGLVPFDTLCGHERIQLLLDERLALFGLSFDDTAIMVTDCGSDVTKVAQVVDKLHMPSLARINNLIAKKIIYETEPEEDEADNNNPLDSEYEEEWKNVC